MSIAKIHRNYDHRNSNMTIAFSNFRSKITKFKGFYFCTKFCFKKNSTVSIPNMMMAFFKFQLKNSQIKQFLL